MKWFLFFLAFAATSYALESNMLAQQAWNVEQLRDAKQRRATPTPKGPTPTFTQTPNPRWTATPSPTVTISPSPTPTPTPGK